MLLSFSWQSSPRLSSKYYLGWHIQNLLQAVFFAKLIVGFIYDHMAASHVLLKWFACKMGGKKPKHISNPRRKRKKKKNPLGHKTKQNFQSREKSIYPAGRRVVLTWRRWPGAGRAGWERPSVSALPRASSWSLTADGTNHNTTNGMYQ